MAGIPRNARSPTGSYNSTPVEPQLQKPIPQKGGKPKKVRILKFGKVWTSFYPYKHYKTTKQPIFPAQRSKQFPQGLSNTYKQTPPQKKLVETSLWAWGKF